MKKLLIVMLLFTFTLNAQERITVSIGQDVKMAFKGATETNDKPVLNSFTYVKWECAQDKNGYFGLMFGHEYAELSPRYIRYSVDVGYTFNRLFVDNVEMGLYVGLGSINRFNEDNLSFGFGGDINYVMGDMKFGFLLQGTQRTDLGFRYDKSSPYIFSGFVKVTYTIFKTRSRR